MAELYPAPESLRLTVGGSQTVSVSMFDKSGNPLTDIRVSWSAEDPKIASVTQQGVVRALKAGETHVIARAGDKVVTIPVTVRAAAAASATPAQPDAALTLLPAVMELIPGERRTVTAFQQRPGGNVAATGVLWRATQPWVATIDANGVVTGVARGSGQILATLGEASATAQAR
ncbi:MAG: Ig-like domain-containing protein, partial [Candidatus Rokuibacteriota bacterium]